MSRKRIVVLVVLIIIACFFLAAIFTGKEKAHEILFLKGVMGVILAVSLIIYSPAKNKKK